MKRIAMHRLNRKDGFTMVELLAVLLIIGILAASAIGLSGYARRRAAESRCVAELHSLKSGIEEFKIRNGYYPGKLDATTIDKLIPLQGKIGEIDRDSAGSLLDPWGTAYAYVYAEGENEDIFRLYSWGQDRQSETGDDVTATGTM
ncbi:MAG: prepilin-type N-terminal cleavage/methylation domain-containing protein [Spartobacteria bacterium]|nr:prepilin-type N-terminal cleavage/methylation domain-containing protein [Spartobacteria bacterium]